MSVVLNKKATKGYQNVPSPSLLTLNVLLFLLRIVTQHYSDSREYVTSALPVAPKHGQNILLRCRTGDFESTIPKRDLLVLQRLENRLLESLRLAGASPPLQNLAVLVNEELLKVPLDALEAHETGLLLLQPLK